MEAPVRKRSLYGLFLVILATGCAASSTDDVAATEDAFSETATTVTYRLSASIEVPDLAIGERLDAVISRETGDAPSKVLRHYTTTRLGRNLACEEIYIGDSIANVDRGFHPKRFVCTDGEVKTDTFSIFRNLEPDLPVRSFVDENGDGLVDTLVDDGIQAHDENFDGRVDMLVSFAPTESSFAASEAAAEWRLAPGSKLTWHTLSDTDLDGRFDRGSFHAELGFNRLER